MAYLLIFGDSIVNGYWDEEGGWAERLKRKISGRSVKQKEDFYYLQYNLGVSGDTTKELLKRFENEMGARDGGDEYVIVFAIGINDSKYTYKTKQTEVPKKQFEDNLQKLVDKAKKFTDKVLFVGLSPVDTQKVEEHGWWIGSTYTNELIDEYDHIVKQVCLKNKIKFVDVLSEFKKHDYKKLLEDGVHPNTQGHKLMFKVIKKSLEKNIFGQKI